MQQTPTLRLDRSRDFSTVHGERMVGDSHVRVFFYQDGLPFDAGGSLVLDIIEDAGLRAKAERKLKEAAKVSATAEAESVDAVVGKEDGTADKGDVNLESWARGEVKYQWYLVSEAIVRRFARRVTNTADAINLLVEEGVIQPDALSPANRKHLD